MNHNETGPEPSKTDQEIAREARRELQRLAKSEESLLSDETVEQIILSALTKSKRVSSSGEGGKSLAGVTTPHAQGQTPATDERQPEACLWLIWSNEHHAWWGANQFGYVKTKGNAGQYAFDKAVSICRSANRGLELPNETMLPVLAQRVPQTLANRKRHVLAVFRPRKLKPIDANP